MATLLVRHKYSHRRMRGHIIAAWGCTTPDERARGAAWYAEANEHAACIGDLVGAGTRAGAAALAVLSPQVEWGVNIREAYQVACDVADGILSAENTYAAFPINVEKAWSILSDPSIIDATVSGPKVTAFYRAIAGLPGGPVIDRHATRIATAHKYDAVSRSTYGAVQSAYIDAARILGLDEHTLQAATWLVCKRQLGGG